MIPGTYYVPDTYVRYVPPVDAHVWRQLHLSAVARCSDSYCIFFFFTSLYDRNSMTNTRYYARFSADCATPLSFPYFPQKYATHLRGELMLQFCSSLRFVRLIPCFRVSFFSLFWWSRPCRSMLKIVSSGPRSTYRPENAEFAACHVCCRTRMHDMQCVRCLTRRLCTFFGDLFQRSIHPSVYPSSR